MIPLAFSDLLKPEREALIALRGQRPLMLLNGRWRVARARKGIEAAVVTRLRRMQLLAERRGGAVTTLVLTAEAETLVRRHAAYIEAAAGEAA